MYEYILKTFAEIDTSNETYVVLKIFLIKD